MFQGIFFHGSFYGYLTCRSDCSLHALIPIDFFIFLTEMALLSFLFLLLTFALAFFFPWSETHPKPFVSPCPLPACPKFCNRCCTLSFAVTFVSQLTVFSPSAIGEHFSHLFSRLQATVFCAPHTQAISVVLLQMMEVTLVLLVCFRTKHYFVSRILPTSQNHTK